MKNGYYTDLNNNVLGYWELNEKPIDGDGHIWIESSERPAIYVPPPTLQERIAQIDAQLDVIDAKSIRALRTNDTERLASYEALAESLRAERATLNG